MHIIDNIEHSEQSFTATVCESAQLFGATPERGEFDPATSGSATTPSTRCAKRSVDNAARIVEHRHSTGKGQAAMNRSEFRVRVAARSSLPRAYAASARTAVISTFTNGPQSTRRCWLSGLGRHRDARIPKHFTQGADVALQIWTMFAFVPQPALRPPGTRTFVTERDSTLKSTGLDYASMRSNRQKPHAAARQFPARSKSCDRATRRCAPVIADTLPPCLRPATAHGPTADETQPTHKQRTHDFTGLTATAPAQFTTFVAGTCGRECADSPHVRTTAQTSRPHRLPRARVPCIQQAAGLLRRHRCGPLRAADAQAATQPLSAAAGRAPSLCTAITRGIRCIAT